MDKNFDIFSMHTTKKSVFLFIKLMLFFKKFISFFINSINKWLLVILKIDIIEKLIVAIIIFSNELVKTTFKYYD